MTTRGVGEGTAVIVSCPSCSTCYHEDPVPGGAVARCSGCSTTFALPRARRAYRIFDATEGHGAGDVPRHVAGGPTQVPLVVPTTAGQARGDEGSGLALGMDDPSLAQHLEHTGLKPEAGAPRAALSYRVAPGRETAVPGADAGVEEPAAGRRLGAWTRPLGVALGITLGVSTGWALDETLKLGTLPALVASGAVGLSVGWIFLRWRSTKS